MIGTFWKHRKGGAYLVWCEAKIEADLTPVIVYQSLKDGEFWVRPKSEFMDGRFTQIETTGEL